MIGEIAMAAGAMLVGGDAMRGLALALPHTTSPPDKHVVLYDGHCKFCTGQARNVEKLARPGALELVSFQDAGALDRFPGITHQACMEEMHLVTPTGRIYRGLESAIKTVSTRRALAPLAHLYYLPGLRALGDAIYALIAANRYRIAGKAVAAGDCDTGCAVHFGKKS